jgi:hypothetical protein
MHTDGKPANSDLTAPTFTDVRWQKSRRSNSQGTCVELAGLPDGDIAVRNSRFPDGAVLRYTKADMRALIEGVKKGDFDNFLR